MQNLKEPSGFFAKSTRALHSQEENLMAPNSSTSCIYHITNSYSYRLWWYNSLHIGLVPGSSGSSAHIPASCLVVPYLAATQEIHFGTYVASHEMGHHAAELNWENGVLAPQKDPFLHTEHLGEIGQDFWLFKLPIV